MSEKMKVMLLERLGPIETRPLRLAEIERHKIARPDELLVKIEACGVCHSQLHGIEGDWKDIGIPPQLPTVPGHEVVGRVVETGNAVSDIAVGERVGITPLLESCLECTYCLEGKEYLCESMEVTGETLRGGYAEYITVSEKFATRVPDSMDPGYAAPLFCAGITAYKAVKASEPAAERKVGIFGIGGVGHLAVQFAAIKGCKVTAVSRNPRHLEIAKKLGAQHAVPFETDQSSTLEHLKNTTGLLDSAIVFAPSESATDTAIKSVKKGGLVVLATVGRIPDFPTFEEKTVRGTLIGSRQDMRDVIDIAQKHKLEVVYQEYPLEDANDVLKKLKDSELDARAVLVPGMNKNTTN